MGANLQSTLNTTSYSLKALASLVGESPQILFIYVCAGMATFIKGDQYLRASGGDIMSAFKPRVWDLRVLLGSRITRNGTTGTKTFDR
jgi:hypothetical protein